MNAKKARVEILLKEIGQRMIYAVVITVKSNFNGFSALKSMGINSDPYSK
jgi:hypothetical protein